MKKHFYINHVYEVTAPAGCNYQINEMWPVKQFDYYILLGKLNNGHWVEIAREKNLLDIRNCMDFLTTENGVVEKW